MLNPPSLEDLLADPRLRPPGGWSARAEQWAEDRDVASWRDVGVNRRRRRDLAQAEGEAHELAAELAASEATRQRLARGCPDV